MKRLYILLVALFLVPALRAMESGSESDSDSEQEIVATTSHRTIWPTLVPLSKSSLKMQARKAMLEHLATCKDVHKMAALLEKLPAADVLEILYKVLTHKEFGSYSFIQKKELVERVAFFGQMKEQKEVIKDLDMMQRVLTSCENMMAINMQDMIEPSNIALRHSLVINQGMAELWAEIKDNKLIIKREDYDDTGKLLQEGILVTLNDFDIGKVTFEELDENLNSFSTRYGELNPLMQLQRNNVGYNLAQVCWLMGVKLKMRYLVSTLPVCTTLDELIAAIVALPGLDPLYVVHFFLLQNMSDLQAAYLFYGVQQSIKEKRPDINLNKNSVQRIAMGGSIHGAMHMINEEYTTGVDKVGFTIQKALENDDFEAVLRIVTLIPKPNMYVCFIKPIIEKKNNKFLSLFSIGGFNDFMKHYDFLLSQFYYVQQYEFNHLLQLIFDQNNSGALKYVVDQGVPLEDYHALSGEKPYPTTALLEAIKKGDSEAVEFLVRAGAMINRLCPATGKTILEIAKQELGKAREEAKKHGKEEEDETEIKAYAKVKNYEEIYSYLIQQGATNDIPYIRERKKMAHDLAHEAAAKVAEKH